MTDYLNPDKLYPDDIIRRIDTPPGFDNVREKEELYNEMSKLIDNNGEENSPKKREKCRVDYIEPQKTGE